MQVLGVSRVLIPGFSCPSWPLWQRSSVKLFGMGPSSVWTWCFFLGSAGPQQVG